jgi:NADH-quinone oxidoreductase subunit C
MDTTVIKDHCEAALHSVPSARHWSVFLDCLRLHIEAGSLLSTMSKLKDAGFNMLVDVTAVDLLEYEGAVDRYRVVYQLLNTESGARLEVTTPVNDPSPQVPTMTTLWRAADWLEREVYDMFGILFAGHPNAKRLLLPEEFASFPLRKDYPLKGRGERHNFPVVTRSES